MSAVSLPPQYSAPSQVFNDSHGTIGSWMVSDKLVSDIADYGITTYFGVSGGEIGRFFLTLLLEKSEALTSN